MVIQVDEIAVPASPDAPAFIDYEASLAVRNRNEADVLGPAAPYVDPAEALPYFQDQADTTKRLFVARLDGEVVGQALLEYARRDDARVGWLFGGVLPHARRRGAGRALFDEVEGEAQSAGCTTFQSMVLHGAGGGTESVVARSGFGRIPAADAGVRFLQARGYGLEQVSRWNLLDLAAGPTTQRAALEAAQTAAGSVYRVKSWMGPSPDDHLHDLAALSAAMERDAPHASLDVHRSTWTPERVRREEDNELSGGRQLLTTVAEHIATGRLAGVTRLSLPSDPLRPVTQGITIVDPDHRGHSLGLWIKAANVIALRQASPDAALVMTGNAEENVHMLAINEALGFKVVGYTGAWKKILTHGA